MINHNKIHRICEKYDIKNYTINEDGSIDVNDSVTLYFKHLDKIPLKFNRVIGSFYCSNNNLTSLEGSPEIVGANFNCTGNRLTSLEYSPKYVGGYYYCNNNELTTLNGYKLSINKLIFNDKYILMRKDKLKKIL